MHPVLPLGVLALLLPDLAAALRFPVAGKRIERRSQAVYGESTLNNTDDFQYSTTISLGGQSWETLIDTGSSDLWVAGTVPNSKTTGFTSGVQYAIGEVSGPVLTSTLIFAGHTIQNQAFLQITPDDTNPAGTGLIGLGPNSGSNIFETMGGVDAGAAPVDNIFRENTSTPNFITTLLGRIEDLTESFAASGEITVGEIVPGYEGVTSMPKLPVSRLALSDSANQHWQTLVDANGIIVNGQAISGLVTSVSTTQNSAQMTAVFDSGFSIPQVTTPIANAMFSGVTGSSFQDIDGLGEIWTFPCDSEINITFMFGGKPYPVHPLDAALDAGVSYSNGTKVCVGGFQPISTDSGGDYDLILGMAFLRNVYMLVNFGDFIDDDPTVTTDPYVQFLSTTNDSAAAHAEFVKVRDGSSKSSSGGGGSGGGSGGGGGGGSGSGSGSSLSSKTRTSVIITVASVVGVLILSGITSWFNKRRAAQSRILVVQQASANESKWGPSGQNYQSLNAPAPLPYQPYPPPAGAPPGQYNPYGNPGPGYTYPPQGAPPPQGGYQTPWNHQG